MGRYGGAKRRSGLVVARGRGSQRLDLKRKSGRPRPVLCAQPPPNPPEAPPPREPRWLGPDGLMGGRICWDAQGC